MSRFKSRISTYMMLYIYGNVHFIRALLVYTHTHNVRVRIAKFVFIPYIFVQCGLLFSEIVMICLYPIPYTYGHIKLRKQQQKNRTKYSLYGIYSLFLHLYTQAHNGRYNWGKPTNFVCVCVCVHCIRMNRKCWQEENLRDFSVSQHTKMVTKPNVI